MRDFRAGPAGLGMTCAPPKRSLSLQPQPVKKPFATVDRSFQLAGAQFTGGFSFLRSPTKLAWRLLVPDSRAPFHASATSENEPHDLLLLPDHRQALLSSSLLASASRSRSLSSSSLSIHFSTCWASTLITCHHRRNFFAATSS